MAKAKGGLTAAEVRERVPSDFTLTCPIDNRLFRDAVKTPCCNKVYCEECIQTHLLERDFVCPNCGKRIASLDKLLVDKPTRTKVADYIEKVMEESKREGGDEGYREGKSDGSLQQVRVPPLIAKCSTYLTLRFLYQSATSDDNFGDHDIYSENQPDLNLDMSQMVVDQIPQLQAQIAQISQALQNPNLPDHVRHQTDMQHHHLQIQLTHAQTVQAALAVASYQQQQQQQVVAAQQAAAAAVAAQNNAVMGGFNSMGGMGYNQMQANPADSAYQRLPVNNRRRNKRDRPSDFFETAGPDGTKVPRYWE